jgi:hypothetical protein
VNKNPKPTSRRLHQSWITASSNVDTISLYYIDCWKMIIWLVLKLEISYRVIISWYFLLFLRMFWRFYFCMVIYLSFHNSSFALRYFFYVNGKATVWHTPCLFCFLVSKSLAVYYLQKLWTFSNGCELSGEPLQLNMVVKTLRCSLDISDG